MSNARLLRARKWKLVSWHIGLIPKFHAMEIPANGTIRWLRIGLWPGIGTFKRTGSMALFNGLLFLWSPESRTCTYNTGYHRKRAIYNLEKGHTGWGHKGAVRSRGPSERRMQKKTNPKGRFYENPDVPSQSTATSEEDKFDW